MYNRGRLTLKINKIEAPGFTGDSNDNVAIYFPDRIRFRRLEAKKTKAQIAKVLDYSIPEYAAREAGDIAFSYSELKLIASYLSVELLYFFVVDWPVRVKPARGWSQKPVM